MNLVLVLLLGIVIGIGIVIGWREDKGGTDKSSVTRRAILALFDGKSEITNDDVQNALGVSDATATRYLDALEKEGVIKQIGSTGRFVTYRRI